ncbi:AMP-binding protein [Variovorax sp. J22R115]|uniref:AMP-binding protein n=1 Tax=Variovorax sp. J22R115 TaxID=3053509 RepID=UPI0025771C0E|nr:AMP-binding protein [Variovorax sp. J22R115]MDM0053053.1 AMP-binding protein [Variovorax sp. J22R115]
MKLGAFDDPRATLAELKRVLARFNDNRTDYPRERSVSGLFAEQAAARPDALAVIHDGRAYTYGQLEAAANRFARLLLDQGVRSEDRVAVMVDDAFESTAVILGTLKAGAAYVPIDARTPFERIRYMLDDTQARLLAVQKRDIRAANRLHWVCARLEIVFCVDSRDVQHESESLGAPMQEPIWDHAAQTAIDDITAGGWTSSYTGEPLSREVMDAYGDNIRTKLRPFLTPATRLLEIACGSAISLRRLAPLVGDYCATDVSRSAIDWARRAVESERLSNVRLHHVPADGIDRVDADPFDVAVLNSVIQCFSGYNYLRDVLRKVIAKMGDRGLIFLGHLLDLERKDRFVESLVEFHSRHSQHGYRTKIDRSDDLFVSRAFIDDLRYDFPEIVSIECSGLLGGAESELTEYGYDAILRIDKGRAVAPTQPRFKRQLDWAALDGYDPRPVADTPGPRSLAYVIYTSGTSGQPKGVMVEHRGIVRLVVGTDYLRLGPEVRILQTGSVAFDASTFEIWGALLNGGVLCRPPEHSILDPAEVARQIVAHGITTMFLTTGLFHQHADSGVDLFSGLKHLVFGGERASLTQANRIRERYPQLALFNAYGPTENTAFTTLHRIERSYTSDIPIGRPIANTQVLILGPDGAPVPIGVAGEICAAGDGLARGYLGDPELTQRKFAAHPWEPGQRIYRTGDSGLWRADGTIEYLGRLDDQVKIRGFRVEPAEIEHCILEETSIRQARVVARSAGGDGQALVAYVVMDAPASDERLGALRERLRRLLPDYMVPAHVVALDQMPLNASGKVDSRALPDPRPTSADGVGRFDAPASEIEKQLAAIFQEVLEQPRVGAMDDFFDRGGHSMKVTKAVALIERRLGVAVALRTFFLNPTVRALADQIVGSTEFGVAGIDEPMVPLNRGEGPALFAFPPGTGDALGYMQLAALLPWRFYGFNFIEAGSRLGDYAGLIESVDPQGPYLLLGYSSGGNLAYHVARELERRGRRVAAIVMIDSARQLRPTPLADEEIERASESFLGDPSVQPYLASPVLHEKARRLTRSALRHVARAVDAHVLGADIHVIDSHDPVTEVRDADGTLLISQDGWAEATTGRFARHAGFGDHNRMLWPPHLEGNAALIRAILAHTGAEAASVAASATLPATMNRM